MSTMTKKKKWTWGAFLAAIAVASGVGITNDDDLAQKQEPAAVETQAPTPEPTTPSPAPVATPTGFEVDRVVDGDTVRIVTDAGVKTVRIIGIDTPETVHPRMDVECYGPEASAEAKRLLEGTRVTIERDPTQGSLDRYGRVLGYVTMEDGRDFGQHMIEGGFAEEVTYDGMYENQGEYRTYERIAKIQEKGMWSACS